MVTLNGDWRASLWHGSAASWVNLNPTLASWSQCWGVDGGQQVGVARMSGVTRACLWYGTAASWVDLHPPGTLSSCAMDAHAGHQVGYLSVSGLHATLWSGTAASCVDLNPEWALQSAAYGVHLDQQVGYALASGAPHAVLWNGSAASCVDLHAYLPPDFNKSEAHGIWRDASFTYVAGWGHNLTTDRNEALLWVGPLPASGVGSEGQAAVPHLAPAWPNPFAGATEIHYLLREEGHVRVDILDVTGRVIATALDDIQPAGAGRVSWNAARMPSGTYLCRTNAAGVRMTQKLTVLR
jgi:hypothetical protein